MRQKVEEQPQVVGSRLRQTLAKSLFLVVRRTKWPQRPGKIGQHLDELFTRHPRMMSDTGRTAIPQTP